MKKRSLNRENQPNKIKKFKLTLKKFIYLKNNQKFKSQHKLVKIKILKVHWRTIGKVKANMANQRK